MKERPILLNTEMVRAVLDGRKTQTRRMVANVDSDNCLPLRKPTKIRNGVFTHVMDAPKHGICPFGAVGDRLWVRETFATLGNEDGCPIDWHGNLVKGGGQEAARIYRASCEQRPSNYGLWSIPDDAFWKPHTENMHYEGTWVPSIHMPRWASRITLEITGVRVERLNSISEQDAASEGVGSALWFAAKGVPEKQWTSLGERGAYRASHINSFASLWESIYGEESWQANPWVWVIEFKRVEANHDN